MRQFCFMILCNVQFFTNGYAQKQEKIRIALIDEFPTKDFILKTSSDSFLSFSSNNKINVKHSDKFSIKKSYSINEVSAERSLKHSLKKMEFFQTFSHLEMMYDEIRRIIQDVEIIIIPVFRHGYASETDIYNALEIAYEKKATILCLGWTCEPSIRIKKRLQRFPYVVAAAGNSEKNSKSSFPAQCKGVLSVGACDEQRRIQPFSQNAKIYLKTNEGTSVATAKAVGYLARILQSNSLVGKKEVLKKLQAITDL